MDRTNKRRSHSSTKHMAIDKNNKVEKAIKVASFIKDSMGKLKKIPNYSGLHAHVRSIIDNGKVRTEIYDDD